MAVSFDPTTGITVESADNVRSALREEWQAIFAGDDLPALNVDAETPAGQMIDSETALIVQKDTEVAYLANMFNPLKAEGRWQDAIGQIYFITRKTAEPTVVQCQCVGLYGTVIPKGSIVQNTSGYQLTSLEEATIPVAGTVSVNFETVDTGSIAIAAGTVTKIITTIPGWDTVTNAVAGTVGRSEETRADFETRRFNSVAENAQGTDPALLGTLAAISGVSDVAVLDNRTAASITTKGVTIPAHSVAICIYGGDETEIAEGIYKKLGAGCGTTGGTTVTYTDSAYGSAYSYEVLRPTATTVKVQVTIHITDNTPSTIITDIKNAIYNDFYGNDTNSGNSRVGLGQTLYATRFSIAAIKAAGVVDLVGISVGISGGALGSSVVFNANVEPVLTVDDVTVIQET